MSKTQLMSNYQGTAINRQQMNHTFSSFFCFAACARLLIFPAFYHTFKVSISKLAVTYAHMALI